MSNWIQVGANGYSLVGNEPNQKSVATLPADVGEYEKGSTVVCFTDCDTEAGGQGVRRKFFIRNVGETEFTALTVWSPNGDEIYYNKSRDVSFVLYDGHICAVTDTYHLDGSNARFVPYYGIHDLSQGPEGDWTDLALRTAETWSHSNPDIAVSNDGKICTVWNFNFSSDTYILKLSTEAYDNTSSVNDWYEHIVTADGSSVPSVLFKDNDEVYIHWTGDFGGSDTTSLVLANWDTSFDSRNVKCHPDLAGAQMCEIENGAGLGFMNSATSDNFCYYLTQAGISDKETVSEEHTPGERGYGLSFRNGYFHAIICPSSENMAYHRVRLAGAEQTWEDYSPPISVESNYPADELTYCCAETTKRPAGIVLDHFGFVGTILNDTGSTTWPQYYRGIYSTQIPPPEEDNYWEDGRIYSARSADVIDGTLALSKRELNGLGFNVVDSIVLSDNTILIANNDGFKTIDYDNYWPLTWESGDFPDTTTRIAVTGLYCDFDGLEDFDVVVKNEQGDLFTVSIASTDSGKRKNCRLGGRRFSATVKDESSSNVVIHQIELEYQITQNRL